MFRNTALGQQVLTDAERARQVSEEMLIIQRRMEEVDLAITNYRNKVSEIKVSVDAQKIRIRDAYKKAQKEEAKRGMRRAKSAGDLNFEPKIVVSKSKDAADTPKKKSKRSSSVSPRSKR